MTDHTLLLVDRLRHLAGLYKAVLTGAGYRVICAETAEQAQDLCRADQPVVAITDLRQTGRGGLDAMRRCLEIAPDTRFIVVAADDSPARVVEAMRAGAFDYLVTPLGAPRLLSAVAHAATLRHRPHRSGTVPARPARTVPIPPLLGTSAAMRSVFERMESLARIDAPFLISGEYGTGKDLCASSIHARSARHAAPYRVLDCRSLSAHRLHAAFAGVAGGTDAAGTMVLNEITHIDRDAQQVLRSHLARVRSDGPAAPRLIAACTDGPARALSEGRLDPALLARFEQQPLDLPPLREREDDVILLAEHALSQGDEGARAISAEAAECLRRYDWPGNVRQLIHMMRNISNTHRGESLTVAMLPKDIATAGRPGLRGHDLIGRSMADIERMVIEATIAANHGSVPRAAAVLGLSPSTLYRKLDAWTTAATLAAAEGIAAQRAQTNCSRSSRSPSP